MAIRLFPLAALLLAAGPAQAQGIGETLRSLLPFGNDPSPPMQQGVPASPEDVPCPRVGVIEGGSALRQGGGQITISDVARECRGRPDGSIVVKVGVEVRTLLGTGGGAPRSDVPVRFVVRRGDKVFMTRQRRVAAAIRPGDTQGTATLVEDGLVVPAGVEDWEVEVGLGAGSPEGRGRRER